MSLCSCDIRYEEGHGGVWRLNRGEWAYNFIPKLIILTF